MTLYDEHINDLHRSGLSDQTIQMMECYSMRPADISRKLGFDSDSISSALAFPYFNVNGEHSPFLRIKVFPSFKDKEGHLIKYLQAKKSGTHLYILPQVIKFLGDPKTPIWIIEGEKKTAKAVEIGIIAVGLGGIWNWIKPGSTDLIEDFDKINFWKREVFILPDADTWQNTEKSKNLKLAAYALAKALQSRGATVKFKVQKEGDQNGVGV